MPARASQQTTNSTTDRTFDPIEEDSWEHQRELDTLGHLDEYIRHLRLSMQHLTNGMELNEVHTYVIRKLAEVDPRAYGNETATVVRMIKEEYDIMQRMVEFSNNQINGI